MLNITTDLAKIKRQIYTLLAKYAYEGRLAEKIEGLPGHLANENTPRFRCCEYKEQAILAEWIKLALGFNPGKFKNMSLSEMVKQIDRLEEDKQVIHVLSKACDRCPMDIFLVTEACRNCIAHVCVNSCPKNAITIIQNRAFIDQDKCVECGRCEASCPYGAIHKLTRPCQRACAVNAIEVDDNRRASIDYEKCIGCGNCVMNCPFGAIEDSTQIVQTIKMLKTSGTKVKAILAPSFVGQFGTKITPARIKSVLLKIGFAEVYEVALGADMVALHEADEFVHKIESGQRFMTSSCCPSFLNLIFKHFPELTRYASATVSPMLALARLLKKAEPECKVIFIGPCISKKVEAKNEESVDAVLTFEELGCILNGIGINLADPVPGEEDEMIDASGTGRSFPYAGGVRGVIQKLLEEKGKGHLINPFSADGIGNCKKALQQLADGELKYNYFEGMGCPGGCVGGPGILVNSKAAARLVQKFAAKARWESALRHEGAETRRKSLGSVMERKT